MPSCEGRFKDMRQRKVVALLALTIGMLAVLPFGPGKSGAVKDDGAYSR